MSQSSNSASGGQGWPKYGPLPLIRCPRCDRVDPLIRRTSSKWENGNYGREYVKCQSKPVLGKVQENCNYFMWIEDYVKMLERSGLISNSSSREMVATTTDWNLNRVELSVELKKINENLDKITENLGKLAENLGKITDQIRAVYAIIVFIAVLFLAMNYGSK